MARWFQLPAMLLGAGLLLIDAMGAPAALAVAPIDPALTTAVVDLCAQVASEEIRGDNRQRGQCVGKTKDWVAALIPPPDATAEDSDKAIADLVVKLAELVQKTKVCNDFNTEIAQAINLASGAAHDAEQKARIEEIAFTIQNCVPQVRTAAISASPV